MYWKIGLKEIANIKTDFNLFFDDFILLNSIPGNILDNLPYPLNHIKNNLFVLAPHIIKDKTFELKDKIFFYEFFKEYFNDDKSTKNIYDEEKMTHISAFYLLNGRDLKQKTIQSKNLWIRFLNIFYKKFSFKPNLESIRCKIQNIMFYDSKSRAFNGKSPGGRSGLNKDDEHESNQKYIHKMRANTNALKNILKDDIKLAENFLFNEKNMAFIPDEDLNNYDQSLNLKNNQLISNNYRVIQKQKIRDSYSQLLWRKKLLEIKNKCWINNCLIDLPEVLVASHIVPFALASESEKFDKYNGLILCSNHDALFDSFLITFDYHNHVIKSTENVDLKLFSLNEKSKLELVGQNNRLKNYLKWHNKKTLSKL